ncbi:hypothetical protein H310_09871 [Aphanomyces invadans]|uniref:Uncharacterized protein n=1 Tax=Aphanomyces invadans TaxID=157072 RepID=A0A024TUN5_9STRA|nr:hypothetical protein H310_09871 [Aphanomyces invadans]ETV97042.1 hypothetical protein H310_09871 [Aphanomyces invadans]|eukprot:XP_008874288.1 hypothetical protein H310_09871 [Aphanomyces invadans]
MNIVVASAELLPQIVQFQEGVYFEVHTLIPRMYANNFDLFPFQVSYVGCHAVPSDGKFDRVLSAFDSIFSPFYGQYGVVGVDRLLKCAPKLSCIVLAHAARSGRMDLLRQYPQVNRDLFQRVSLVEQAARFGHLTAVDYLLGNGHPPCVLDVPAAHGHFAIVQRLHHTTRAFCTPNAMDMAAKNGHLNIVEFLHTYRTEGCTVAALDDAAKAGHVAIVRFLLVNRTEGGSAYLPDDVAAAGHLGVLHMLHDAGMRCTSDAMDRAAGHGHFDLVVCLHELDGCSSRAMDLAAENGFMNVVEFLHNTRHEGCTTYAMDRAAKNGFLDVVRFLHTSRDEGCTTNAVDWAARNNQVEVVLFLCTHRHEGFTHRAVVDAQTMGHAAVTSILMQHSHLNTTTTMSCSF